MSGDVERFEGFEEGDDTETDFSSSQRAVNSYKQGNNSDAWKKYKQGLNRKQLRRKLIDATKTRDGVILRDALSEHHFDDASKGEEFANKAILGEDTVYCTAWLLGIDSNVLEDAIEDVDSIRDWLKQNDLDPHLNFLSAIDEGRSTMLRQELAKYLARKKRLIIWPCNFGVMTYSEETAKPQGIGYLQHEGSTQQEALKSDFEKIDESLSRHLLRVIHKCKDNMTEGKRNTMKQTLKENFEDLDDAEINRIEQDMDGIPEQLEEEEDQGQAVPNQVEAEPVYDESDEEQEVELSEKQVRTMRLKEKQEREIDSEIEDAKITLQLLRIKQAMNHARFARLKNSKQLYEDAERKRDLKEAIRDCENFLSDAKYAITAAKKIQAERRKEEKQLAESKQVRDVPTYQTSKEERMKLEQRRQAQERKKRSEEASTMYKGKAVRIEKKQPWTQRHNWNTDDAEKMAEFKEMLEDHSDLKGYTARLQACLEELYTDLAAAKRQLDSMSSKEMKRRTLQMNRNTLSEVRRYQNPPLALHGIVQAMLLLFGEDEYTTMEWEKCKTLLNPNGTFQKPGLDKKVLHFNPADVHPEIALRSMQILDGISFQDAQKTSPAAAAYYVWTKGVLEDMEESNSIPPSSRPASVDRQLELFGKPAVYPRHRVKREVKQRQRPRYAKYDVHRAQYSHGYAHDDEGEEY